MGLITDPVEKKFFKNLLLKSTVHFNPANARKFYISCIDNAGYILKPNISDNLSEPEDEQEELFRQMEEIYRQGPSLSESDTEFCELCNTQKIKEGNCRFCENYSGDVKLGYQESQQMTQRSTILPSTNRSFIGPLDDSLLTSGNRLSEINTWINMTKDEVELKKVNEVIADSLNALRLSDQDLIRKMAINIFWNIMEYYKNNYLKLKANKGDLRMGYVILAIEYSINYFGRTKSLDAIGQSIDGARLSMIPDARKNIKKIFAESPDYSFLLVNPESTLLSTLCNLEYKFPLSIVSKIKQVKSDLVNSKSFGNPIENVELAACIYYITSIPISKGGILQEKETFTIDGVQTKITQDFLKRYCGNMTLSLLTKNTNVIIQFYKMNPNLKQRLISVR
jgi:hypothetical protein